MRIFPRLRLVLTLIGVACAGLVAAPVLAAPAPPSLADRMLGDAKAPVTVIEYGSVACPICGRFNDAVIPMLKTKYIATGKVRYIFRPMLTGVPTIAISGERLAECAGKDKYFSVVDAVMKGQKEFYAFGESDVWYRPVILRIAKSFGFDEAAFDKCNMDAAALKTLNVNNAAYIDSGIDSTPTIVVIGATGKTRTMVDPDAKTLEDAIAAAGH